MIKIKVDIYVAHVATIDKEKPSHIELKTVVVAEHCNTMREAKSIVEDSYKDDEVFNHKIIDVEHKRNYVVDCDFLDTVSQSIDNQLRKDGYDVAMMLVNDEREDEQ